MTDRTTEPDTFYLGLTMAGAISAGAYTGGVLDVLLDAFVLVADQIPELELLLLGGEEESPYLECVPTKFSDRVTKIPVFPVSDFVRVIQLGKRLT